MRTIQTVLTAMALCASWGTAYAQPPSSQSDNTKVNQRDRAAGEPTADQQKENASDRDLTKKIRRAIVTDKSLSTYAHNIKIISAHGTVTLKGPVRSEEEKKAVLAKAESIAGSAGRIHDELSVRP